MRRNILIILALILFILSFNSIILGASINNLITAPTADVLNRRGALSGNISGNNAQIELVYLLDPKLEVGGAVTTFQEHSKFNLGPVVKFNIIPETPDQPAITTGLQNNNLYLVLSKELGYGIRGHMGLGNGYYSDIFIGINKFVSFKQGVIISEEDNESIPVFPAINVAAEYIDRQINLGARMKLQNNISVNIGILDLSEFNLGVSFLF